MSQYRSPAMNNAPTAFSYTPTGRVVLSTPTTRGSA